MLRVKSIFGPTIQGEGAEAGLGAIFIRFAGCNMWNGLPETREKSQCPYCDTDFHGGRDLTVEDIIYRVVEKRGNLSNKEMLVVLSGGEPLLQPPEELGHLLKALYRLGFYTQIETNGTVANSAAIHASKVTVSPKQPVHKMRIHPLDVTCFKLLYPHPFLKLIDFITDEEWFQRIWRRSPATSFYLQPIDAGPGKEEETKRNLEATIAKVQELGYPWRISLQTHKLMGLE